MSMIFEQAPTLYKVLLTQDLAYSIFAGFKLHKWISNEATITQGIPVED